MDPVDDFSQTSAGDQGLLKHAAGVLRRSAERQDFLLKLSDALRPLRDPLAVQAAACRVLGEHLRASRAYYVEVEPDEEHVITANDYTNGVPSVSGRYRIADFAPFVLDEYRAGRTVIITDTTTDPRIPDPARAQWAAIGITAQAAVPLVKEGRFVAALGVDQDRPRQWTPDEIALLEETAERTWSTVERARTEQALRESEARYRAVVESQAEMVCRFRPDGEFLFVNKAYADRMNTTAEAVIGTDFWQIVAEADKPAVRQMLDSLTPENPEARVENRIETPEGTIWTLWTNRALAFDAAGRVTEAQSTGVDITAIKLAEQALRESEDKYRALFDSMDEGYCIIEMIFDEAGRPADYLFIEVNSAFERQAGMTGAVGRRMLEFVPSIERHWLENYGSVARTGAPIRFANEYKGLNKWFDVYAFRHETWEANRIAVLFTDITARTMAEIARRQSEADARFLSDLSERIRTASDPRELIATVARETGIHLQVDRCHFSEVFLDENRWTIFEDYHVSGESHVGSYRLSDYDPWLLASLAAGVTEVINDAKTDPRTAEIYATGYEPLGVRSGVVVPMLRDGRWVAHLSAHMRGPRAWKAREIELLETIGERVWNQVEKLRLDAQLREAHAELESRVEQRTHELAEANRHLSDEIEERKTLEQTRIQLIRRIVTSQEEERRRMSRDLHDQLGQQMTVLRLKLLALSQSAEGHDGFAAHVREVQQIADRLDEDVSFLSSQLRPTALDDLGLENALRAYTAEWSHHTGIPLEFHSNLAPEERVDPEVETQLYRIAQEALNNTAKHAHATQVAVLLEQTPDAVILIVEDNGQGFDTTTDPQPTTSKAHNLGLLNMTERANLVGGNIQIESTKGQGTTILTKMPRLTASAAHSLATDNNSR